MMCFPYCVHVPQWCHSCATPVNKKILRIFGLKLIRIKKLNQNLAKRSFKKRRGARFFFTVLAAKFQNVTFLGRQRKHFWGSLTIFLVTQLPPKKRGYST